MNEISSLRHMMQSTLTKLCAEISKDTLDESDYTAIVDTTLVAPFIIAVDAGCPPVIRVDLNYMLKAITIEDPRERKKFGQSLKRKLALALSKVNRQTRTLANKPLANTIALPEDSSKFSKTNDSQKIHRTLPQDRIRVITRIEMTLIDVETREEVTVTGNTIESTYQTGISELSNLVFAGQTLTLEDSFPEPAITEQETQEPQILIHNVDDAEVVRYNYDAKL